MSGAHERAHEGTARRPRIGRAGVLLLVGAIAGVAPGTAADEEKGAASSRAEAAWEAFPAGHLYGPYVADPLRPQFSLLMLAVSEVGIADSGDVRSLLQLGGRFGLVRRRSGGLLRAWQVSIEAGVNAIFDFDHNQDNIGWDGLYGLVWSAELGASTAVKVGVSHVSAHIGDEIAERTGRHRIDYTRQELVLGLRRDFGLLSAYAEGAWATERRTPELQKPWRAQAGVELESPPFWGEHVAFVAAADLDAWEERDWSVDTSLWLGLAWPRPERTWRAGITYHDGRVPLGEFFQDEETYVGFGLWLDL